MHEVGIGSVSSPKKAAAPTPSQIGRARISSFFLVSLAGFHLRAMRFFCEGITFFSFGRLAAWQLFSIKTP
jgi:hypothetical protein